jgi:hypothetical protein
MSAPQPSSEGTSNSEPASSSTVPQTTNWLALTATSPSPTTSQTKNQKNLTSSDVSPPTTATQLNKFIMLAPQPPQAANKSAPTSASTMPQSTNQPSPASTSSSTTAQTAPNFTLTFNFSGLELEKMVGDMSNKSFKSIKKDIGEIKQRVKPSTKEEKLLCAFAEILEEHVDGLHKKEWRHRRR